MVRTACHRFVLPTPLSRTEQATPMEQFALPNRSARTTMPFNNAAERALRCVPLGRKAWLFCGSDRGGQRAATLYTLIQTARLNDVDPQAWLADVLARIAEHPARQLDQLMPWNWQPAQRPIAT